VVHNFGLPAASVRYKQLRTRLKLGEHSFTFAGLAAWNTLPSSIQELSDTESFKGHRKTPFSSMLRLLYLVLISFLF